MRGCGKQCEQFITRSRFAKLDGRDIDREASGSPASMPIEFPWHVVFAAAGAVPPAETRLVIEPCREYVTPLFESVIASRTVRRHNVTRGKAANPTFRFTDLDGARRAAIKRSGFNQPCRCEALERAVQRLSVAPQRHPPAPGPACDPTSFAPSSW